MSVESDGAGPRHTQLRMKYAAPHSNRNSLTGNGGVLCEVLYMWQYDDIDQARAD